MRVREERKKGFESATTGAGGSAVNGAKRSCQALPQLHAAESSHVHVSGA